VILGAARDVIPYLADAVPGWFQAVMKVTDSAGNELEYADSFQFSQDPVICFEVPRDDQYTLHIHDALFRGREDFVYRITLGEIPLVTSVFPLGARWNDKTTIQLEGWNLAQTTLETTIMDRRQFRPVRWFSVPQGGGQTVRVPVQFGQSREEFDVEPNNDVATAQHLGSRVVINGRIETPGDEDLFFVPGPGRLAFEVHARRQGSPLDSILSLMDAKGKELAYSDDYEDKAQGLLTHHADSRLVASVPAAGAYVRIGDAQAGGGKNYVYRLSIRPPDADFELRVTPASVIVRPGGTTPVTVHALRSDNFAEDIELALVDPPPGFSLTGGVIPGDADRVTLTLSVPPAAAERPVVLEIEGRAYRRGVRTLITAPAVPAEDMMQAFIWHHLIPVEDWSVIVSGRPVPKPPFEVVMNAPRILLREGHDTLLPIRPLVRNVPTEELKLDIEPEGATAELVGNLMAGFAVKINIDSTKLTSGLRGNLLLRVHRLSTPKPSESSANPKPWRVDFGCLPAIPFEVSKYKPSR